MMPSFEDEDEFVCWRSSAPPPAHTDEDCESVRTKKKMKMRCWRGPLPGLWWAVVKETCEWNRIVSTYVYIWLYLILRAVGDKTLISTPFYDSEPEHWNVKFHVDIPFYIDNKLEFKLYMLFFKGDIIWKLEIQGAQPFDLMRSS